MGNKATCILINNVIHPGLKALNPGILAVFFFFFPQDPGKDAESIFLHSRSHASGLDAYGLKLTLKHFIALVMHFVSSTLNLCQSLSS